MELPKNYNLVKSDTLPSDISTERVVEHMYQGRTDNTVLLTISIDILKRYEGNADDIAYIHKQQKEKALSTNTRYQLKDENHTSNRGYLELRDSNGNISFFGYYLTDSKRLIEVYLISQNSTSDELMVAKSILKSING